MSESKPVETSQRDKVYYAVLEALEDGEDPREIQEAVLDAFSEYRSK
jgi:hypothetical protein